MRHSQDISKTCVERLSSESPCHVFLKQIEVFYLSTVVFLVYMVSAGHGLITLLAVNCACVRVCACVCVHICMCVTFISFLANTEG